MKRMLAGVLWCVLSVPCVHAMDPWAELKGSVAVRENEGKLFSQKPETQTLIPKILRGEPVRVNIEVSWQMNELACERTKEMVHEAYNAWFQNAANTIKAQHREQEFQDVLPTLQKGVPLKFNCVAAGSKPAPADVTVSFKEYLEDVQKEYGDASVLGFRTKGKNGEPMKVVVPMRPSKNQNLAQRDNILVHELGHTLGIADAYEEGYQKNASNTHRSQHREKQSVMNSSAYYGLKPDDADGLINVIDAWTVHHKKQQYGSAWKKHISQRVLKGWDGLDRNEKTGTSKDHYQMGTSEQVQFENRIRNLDLRAF